MRTLLFIFCLLFPLTAFGQTWDFTRATTAYTQHANGTLSQVPANVPRVADGAEIEGQATQLHGLTEAFDSWTQAGTCAVTPNDHIALNGTLTADLLDNTGGANTDHRLVTTADLGDLTGRTFTGSVYMRADTSHNCTLRLYENPTVGNIGVPVNVYITDQWQRVSLTGTATGGGADTIRIMTYPGEVSVATGAAHFWGANLKELPFVDSYVPNAGAGVTQVTRVADSLNFDIHEANTTKIVLPETFVPNTNRDKLTVFGGWRGLWSSAMDIGATRRLVNIGDSTSANNDFELYVHTDGKVYMSFTDDGGTVRTINSAVHTFYDYWFSVRAVVDFTDLSRTELYVNEAVDHDAESNMTGTATFDTTDCLLRLGADRQGNVDGFNKHRNLRVTPSEIRP